MRHRGDVTPESRGEMKVGQASYLVVWSIRQLPVRLGRSGKAGKVRLVRLGRLG